MREQEILRDALARAVQSAMGTSPYGDRMTETQSRTAGLEALIAGLPVNTDTLTPLQDMTPGSPTEGAFFIQLGFSALGGLDILA